MFFKTRKSSNSNILLLFCYYFAVILLLKEFVTAGEYKVFVSIIFCYFQGLGIPVAGYIQI